MMLRNIIKFLSENNQNKLIRCCLISEGFVLCKVFNKYYIYDEEINTKMLLSANKYGYGQLADLFCYLSEERYKSEKI